MAVAASLLFGANDKLGQGWVTQAPGDEADRHRGFPEQASGNHVRVVAEIPRRDMDPLGCAIGDPHVSSI
jgi:hypothetical protein